MSLTESIVQYGFSISLIVNAALFIPQIISLIRTKSAKGISLITFGGFNVIQLFTLLHGVYVEDYLLAGGYLLSIATCGTVSLLIIYYRYVRKEIGSTTINTK
ncbi:PQ-loop domain-containing transporter [Legionella shakespearei]|uniref:PQ loop repeat protein n=1 Tax=Legionella shakespearei DSM 23087 TaxID=1122169 RepID=A0A0W0YGX5_9GAMM|nr:PQ-loop domain-containing transporter [Legionella shakespearei]KTD56225.1 PQ loop repeat protein [Legionella shakespearei DSM 23087]